MGTPALTVTPDPGHAGEGRGHGSGNICGLAGAITCRRRRRRHRPVRRTPRRAGRLGGARAPHRPSAARRGWPAACSPRTARAGPARSACCSWGSRRWRCGTTAFLDGLPADVVTARESLVVAVDRADAADLKTVGEWLAAPGPSRHADVGRAGHRTASGAGHSARIRCRDRARRRQSGGRRGAGGALRATRRAVGASGRRDCPRPRRDTVVIANGIDAPTLWPDCRSGR